MMFEHGTMNVSQHLTYHSITVQQVLNGDLSSLEKMRIPEVMFRIDTDPSVSLKRGFQFPNPKSNKSHGMGGIYFWLKLEDAIKYADEDQNNQTIYLVSRPANAQEFNYSFDHMKSRMNRYVTHDAILYGVNTYSIRGIIDPRDEFVKAGQIGHWYLPDLMLKLRR